MATSRQDPALWVPQAPRFAARSSGPLLPHIASRGAEASGAGSAAGGRNNAPLGLGRDAFERGSGRLRPGAGLVLLTPGQSGDNLHSPSLLLVYGGCLQDPILELSQFVNFPHSPSLKPKLFLL